MSLKAINQDSVDGLERAQVQLVQAAERIAVELRKNDPALLKKNRFKRKVEGLKRKGTAVYNEQNRDEGAEALEIVIPID